MQVTGSYTRLQMQMHLRPMSNDEDAGAYADQNAKNLFYFRAYSNLPHNLELNADLRLVGAIPGQGVPRYLEGNLHAFRSIGTKWRLGVTIENLLHGNRTEWDYEDGLVQPRSLRAGIEWRF